jgi:putative heme transporter
MTAVPETTPVAARPSWWRQLKRPLLIALLVGLAAAALATPLRVVSLPLLLALFPAALLVPLQRWMCARGVAPAVAAALLTASALTAVAVALALTVPLMIAQLPQLADSLAAALRAIEGTVETMPIGFEVPGLAALLERGGAMLAENGDPAAQAAAAVGLAGELLAGAVLVVVVLFFYLKDGPRIAGGVHGALPVRWRPHAAALGRRSWKTLGAFFRGQLLIALVDAVFIGAGLLIIGVPLALPLTLLVFLGGLLPIIGAVASGALAVLVALADGGLWPALAVLALVVVVQQAESNLLQPVVMGRLTALHPLLVILSISVGWVALGVVGAFLAVPVAACAARSFDYLREISPSWRHEIVDPSGSARQTSPSLEASST